jgi:hypothetical protein
MASTTSVFGGWVVDAALLTVLASLKKASVNIHAELAAHVGLDVDVAAEVCVFNFLSLLPRLRMHIL